jgi:hypothetical protein
VSRGWRIAIGIVAALVVFNLALRLLGTLTGGTPGGPRASSYATSPQGAAAYAELLGQAGHPVEQVRSLPHKSPPAVGSTAFLLDPPTIRTQDLQALRSFVREGGRLVVSGLPRETVRELAPSAPSHEPVQGIGIETTRVGGGSVVRLADSRPLQNRYLGDGNNAAFGLALAGPRNRPVEFLESYHGYGSGSGSGLSALPLSWKLLLLGLGLSAVVYMVARGRRLGPPEEEGRSLAPPRREYVDSLAAVVGRSKRRDAGVGPVRREARDAVLRRAALPRDVDDDAFRAAARRLGVEEDDAEALVRPARTDDDVLAVGRAAARIRQDHR